MAKKKARIAPSTDPRALGYAPSPRFQMNTKFQEQLFELVERLPKGVFAILCNENARYHAFTGALISLIMPMHSATSIHSGAYVIDSCNRAVLAMKDDDDWIMLMGDDHVFPPELLLRLLAHMYSKDLDIIVPVCFKRSFPPTPVLYDWKDPEEIKKENPDPNVLVPVDLNKYPEGGLHEVYAAGSAGMLIRRRVFDKMTKENMLPWFEWGEGGWGEDLYFCHKAQQLGFKVWADLDMSLGHIINTAIWPLRHENGGKWTVQYDFNTQGGFVLELTD